MIPLADSSGGDAHVTLICADDSVMSLTSSGGLVGAPSAVCTSTSSDIGPCPTLLNVCTTTAYSVNTSRLEICSWCAPPPLSASSLMNSTVSK